MLNQPNNLVYTEDEIEQLDFAMTYIPDREIYEGMICLITLRRTYAIILTEDDEKISFSFDDFTEGDPAKIKQGDWVIFEKHVTEYRTTAINVRAPSTIS